MTLQIGGDRARIERVRGDAVGRPTPGRFDGEEDVRGFRLPVRGPGLIDAEAEVDVIEHYRGALMSTRADSDDAGASGSRERAAQAEREREMAEVVCRELQFVTAPDPG